MSDNAWDVFTKSLATELSRLPDGGIVVIEESSNRNHYAQFLQSSDHLLAELASSPEPPIGIRVSPPVEESLRRSGWQEPDREASIFNWSYELPWPAAWNDYQELALTTTTFLRDTLGIDSPASLVHRSWIRHTNEELELALLGIPPAAPEEH